MLNTHSNDIQQKGYMQTDRDKWTETFILPQ